MVNKIILTAIVIYVGLTIIGIISYFLFNDILPDWFYSLVDALGEGLNIILGIGIVVLIIALIVTIVEMIWI